LFLSSLAKAGIQPPFVLWIPDQVRNGFVSCEAQANGQFLQGGFSCKPDCEIIVNTTSGPITSRVKYPIW
jgi:hypothetical protein